MPLDSLTYQPEPETVRILEAAKARINDPANWCQGCMARDENGSRVNLTGTFWMGRLAAAKAVCAMGSAYLGEDCFTTISYLQKAAHDLGHNSPRCLNDDADHPTVMRMFDRAIELAWQEARETV